VDWRDRLKRIKTKQKTKGEAALNNIAAKQIDGKEKEIEASTTKTTRQLGKHKSCNSRCTKQESL
jgi:hypothetical protein